ncbi:MAG: Pvc16 family protein [Jatrophihabitans sp.]
MFERVDSALRSFLRSGLPDGVAVSFEPARADRLAEPEIRATLYSVQEDLSGRAQGIQGIRNAEGRVTARRAFPRRYALSYAITATGPSVESEHGLLGAVAYLLSQHDVLPAHHADDQMVEAGDLNLLLGPPLPVPADSTIALRLALNLVIVAPMAAPLFEELPKAPEAVELGMTRHERAGTPVEAGSVGDG